MAGGEVLVQCNVCHVAGVVEALPWERDAVSAAWPSVPCVFTKDCTGHIWPDDPN